LTKKNKKKINIEKNNTTKISSALIFTASLHQLLYAIKKKTQSIELSLHFSTDSKVITWTKLVVKFQKG